MPVREFNLKAYAAITWHNDRASPGLEPRLADHRSQAARTETLPTAPPGRPQFSHYWAYKCSTTRHSYMTVSFRLTLKAFADNAIAIRGLQRVIICQSAGWLQSRIDWRWQISRVPVNRVLYVNVMITDRQLIVSRWLIVNQWSWRRNCVASAWHAVWHTRSSELFSATKDRL